jgi:adenine-specific DNA-methyltransferase
MEKEQQSAIRIAYERRNRDLDPQLVWRGKDEQDWSDLVVHAPPLYIQEKVQPKVLIDDLLRRQSAGRGFTGRARRVARQGSMHLYRSSVWIKFNSNFQWSTTSRDVKDGNLNHITREPEQVKAFRDTWREGIHSDLTYLRDRFTVARDLLSDSGSIFVQIGDENVHRVRALLDEVFGDDNCVSEIQFQKTGDQPSLFLANVTDMIFWYSKQPPALKFRRLFYGKEDVDTAGRDYKRIDESGDRYQATSLTSNRPPGSFPVSYQGRAFLPTGGHWKTGEVGFPRLIRAPEFLRRETRLGTSVISMIFPFSALRTSGQILAGLPTRCMWCRPRQPSFNVAS